MTGPPLRYHSSTEFISAISEGAWVHERGRTVRASARGSRRRYEGRRRSITVAEEQEACPAASGAEWRAEHAKRSPPYRETPSPRAARSPVTRVAGAGGSTARSCGRGTSEPAPDGCTPAPRAVER